MTALSEPLMGENVGSPDASRKGQSIVSPQSGPMAHRFLGLGAAVLYGFTAVSMNFVNKASMQMMPLPNVVMVIQMVATFLILQPLLELGVVDFPRFSWQTCRRLFWITALYTANVGFALFGLRTLNVPMYNVLKRLTPMIVLTVKAIIKRRAPQLEVSLSVAMVVTGCVVAGVGDLSFDLVGYLYALASCTMQAAYLLLVEFQGADGVGTNEMLYYNSITSIPFLLMVVAATGEAAALPAAYFSAVQAHGVLSLWSTLLSCSLMGVLLNYALFLCTVNNSALTTTIVGVLKGVVAVILGFFLLGGVKFSVVNVSGIALNTAGAIWYTAIEYNNKRGGKRPMVSASAEPLAGGGGSKEGGSSASLLLMGGGFNGTAGVVSSAALSAMEEQPMTREGAHVVTETAWGAGAVRRHAIA